jgi:septal ring factor EnvC (AmiA/AmiB activator)
LATLAVALCCGPAAWADREEDLAALREAIAGGRERVARYERDERGLLEAIESIDVTAQLLAREVRIARRAAHAAREELAGLEARADELEGQAARSRRALGARARALYRAGELGSVRLLFASQDLPDFLARISSLNRLLDHDAELLVRYREQLAALAGARVAASESAARSSAAERQLDARSAQLVSERARKHTLVQRLHRDRKLERGALVELEKAAQALEETLASLGGDAGQSHSSAGGTPFAQLQRSLAPPVKGELIQGFGRRVDAEFLTETFHSGLVFRAERGTRVEAVAPGSVRFAGWFRGYGRLVILDHGDDYFTVSGHLDELDVAVGDTVRARERIGTVGETGSLAGPRLYFEVRRGGEALDPGGWLQ